MDEVVENRPIQDFLDSGEATGIVMSAGYAPNVGKDVVTKDYVDGSLVYDTGGWMLQCRLDNPTVYDTIGHGAVDLSAAVNNGGDNDGSYGATGIRSFATGINNVAGGENSFAAGMSSVVYGSNSVAFGESHLINSSTSLATGANNTLTSGNSSFVCGNNNTCSSHSSLIFGMYNKTINNYMLVGGSFNTGTAADTVVEIGVGTTDVLRANAFEVYTDGTLTAPEATPAKIHTRGNKTLVTVDYLLSAEFGNSLPTSTGATGTLWNNAGAVSVSV